MAKKTDTIDIALAGLSGQGVIMYSRILATTCVAAGHHVRTYEVLGTAHRGTLIMSHIRIGPDETGFANLIPPCSADFLVGMEPLEGLRIGAYYLASGGKAILNTHKIIPTYASLGRDFYVKHPRKRGYPPVDEIMRDLQSLASLVVAIPATEIAIEAGHFALANVAMLGATAAAGVLPVSADELRETILRLAPKGTGEKNLQAFTLGYQAFEEAVSSCKAAAS